MTAPMATAIALSSHHKKQQKRFQRVQKRTRGTDVAGEPVIQSSNKWHRNSIDESDVNTRSVFQTHNSRIIEDPIAPLI